MAVTYTIFEQLDVVHSRFTGAVPYEQAIAFHEALRGDPAFRPEMRQLSDWREASSQLTAEEVRGLAKRSSFGSGARRAILVADDGTHGLTRMYASQATAAGEIRIFRDQNEALGWLGIEPCAFAEAVIAADALRAGGEGWSMHAAVGEERPAPQADA